MSESGVTFSIITVTYNSAKTIERTMRSVLNQRVLPVEYRIVDGQSTDDTLGIVESLRNDFAERGINLIVTSEPDNGIYDAMNKGIASVSGSIVGMINGDDWYEENALEVVKRAYEEEEFDLFYADLMMHRPDGGTFVKHARNRKYATSRDWNHPTTFITSKVYRDYKYRTETIHDDYDLILRLKKNGFRIVVRNEVIANFTMNGVSHNRSLKDALARVKIKYGIYRRNGYSPFYLFECLLVEAGKLIIG